MTAVRPFSRFMPSRIGAVADHVHGGSVKSGFPGRLWVHSQYMLIKTCIQREWVERKLTLEGSFYYWL
ncbi:hypothetical protein DSO57_1029280 [Entomophthora muscae]|uniref:Uncharacterized protein n=2 Tax=Entomophthora muscae TaxID=34485 RepID=A0ACC2RJC5_9FUNG|nr:hypothetical protein DSO57_1016692 [Entomophthora muscae]KAJ9064566.1 hypothetical protein DSO57_1029280 [Entomophthora muscae]